MISRDTLTLAVARGLLTAEQAERLSALEQSRTAADPLPQDDERLRFISGFGDIFVAIGLLLFLGAAAYFLSGAGQTALYAGEAVASWGLAEFFTRRRRMALPSILLLVTFVGSVAILAAWAFGVVDLDQDPGPGLVGAGLIAALAAALHYRRFATPITPAAGAAALVAMLVGLLYAVAPAHAPTILPGLLVACGLVLFALALRFDRLDPARITRRTDIAFWLHLLAAPLIVHPVMHWLGAWDNTNPAVTLLLFLVLALAALAADRRAILVSGLAYAGVAIGYLARLRGLEENTTLAFALLSLGAVILLLSAGWSPIRRTLLGLLPRHWAAWLPSPGHALAAPAAIRDQS